MIRFLLSGSLLVVLASSILAADKKESEKAPLAFQKMKYRHIGPYTGGRVSRVTGVVGNPLIYYVATASGGVWKSEDGGLNFQPIFDDQPIASIGSIAVAPSDPNVVYVGSGEANIRGNVTAGNGIYKSTDAGKTWKHVWKQIGHIGQMIVHPTNPDIAYAAVLGHAFGPNPERGVYRTKDGGKSWDRILFKDNDTGASDICFDPNNPRILFAGLWQARRKPWEMTSGGPGSGLYMSKDGGDTWTQLGPKSDKDEDEENGLPEGIYGKIAIAVAPSDSKRVYALIESEKGGLYRSDDGGEKWTLINPSHLLTQRIWYFGTLTVDPKNEDVLWAPQVPMLKSIDGGKSFQTIRGFHHGDHHDIWIDPHNTKRMIVGNDGGVDISTDGGKSWTAPPLPIAQFYHISCDNAVPYRVMGCMQDMGTARGPSNSLTGAGILLGDWHTVGGGEAGFAVADPTDPNIVYAGEYGGYISRYDHRLRQARNISIYPYDPSGHGAEDLRYRFQWTSPILVSQHDPKVVYHASNILFRTRDGGQTWAKASPDLTRNDRNKQKWSGGPITGDNTGVETYCTIFAVAESPLDAKIFWAGSDDGLVHVTRDGGKTWTNVTANIPELPDWGTVKCIEPSHFDPGTAYLVVEAHRMDDYRPYLWKTTDFGKSWKKLSEGLPQDAYLHVVREDPKQKGLLFVGSERRISITWNDGGTWQPLQMNMPTVAIHDLVLKDNDLVVGTNGRSIWILDDITPIRTWQEKIASEKIHLFSPSPAVRWSYGSTVSAHQARPRADNPPSGAVIQYFLKEKPKSVVKLEILNAEQKVIQTFISKEEKKSEAEDPKIEDDKKADEKREEESDEEEEDDSPKKPKLPANKGLNRFVWNLLHEGADVIPKAQVDLGAPAIGPRVAPGTYTLRLQIDNQTLTSKLEVLMDRRYRIVDSEKEDKPYEAKKEIDATKPTIDLASVLEQEKFALQVRQQINQLTKAVEQIRSLQKQLTLQQELLKNHGSAADYLKQVKSFKTKLEDLEAKFHNPKAEVNYDILAQKGGAKLYSQLAFLFESAKDGDGAPTQGMKEVGTDLEKELNQYLKEFEELQSKDLKSLVELAKKLDFPILIVPPEKKKSP